MKGLAGGREIGGPGERWRGAMEALPEVLARRHGRILCPISEIHIRDDLAQTHINLRGIDTRAGRGSFSYTVDHFLILHAYDPRLLYAEAVGRAAEEIVNRTVDALWEHATVDYFVSA